MPKSFTVRDLPKTEKEITRQCAVCGGDILVQIFPKGKYKGGNYFHSISECNPDGHCPNHYTEPADSTTLRNPRKSAPSPQRSAIIEYWECNKCYFAID